MKDILLQELIDKCSIFNGIDFNRLHYYFDFSKAKIINLKKDDYVFEDEDIPQGMFVLLDGEVKIEKISATGEQFNISTIDTFGTLFGEVFYLLNSSSYGAFAFASKPSSILYFQLKKSHEYEDVLTIIQANLIKTLAEKLFYLNQKIKILSHTTLRQKICTMLIEIPNSSRMKRNEMAKYLSVARPSLSRELSNMEKDGIIVIENGNIRINDYIKIQYYI